MFLAKRRWLAFESMLVRVGDMQLSLDVGTGEEAADLYKGRVVKVKLV